MFQFSLSEEDRFGLLIMMGYAIGAALHDGNRALANRFIRVTNAVNRDNPSYVPYGEVKNHEPESAPVRSRRSSKRKSA